MLMETGCLTLSSLLISPGIVTGCHGDGVMSLNNVQRDSGYGVHPQQQHRPEPLLHAGLDRLVNCGTTLVVKPTNYLLVSDISKGSDKMSKLPIPTAGGKQVAEDVEFILIGAGEFGIHNIYLEKAPTKLLS